MNIEDLREALNSSPDNHHLRLLLASALQQEGRNEEAEKEYLLALKQKENIKSRLALGEIWLAQENTSAAVVFLEEAIQVYPKNPALILLLAKALVRENNLDEARSLYEQAFHIDPNVNDEELDSLFKISSTDLEEDQIDELFMERPETRFSDVGGMKDVKKEISLKIIKPLQHPELYKAYGKKTGGGILMYGPPGCGKTLIARATAGEINARFISIGINDILDMWIGNSEKNLHQFFELARANTPCVIFIDEIDALGANRSRVRSSGSQSVINQFLAELDGVDSSNDGVLVLGATNMPWNLDPAFRRPGRFDRILFVPPPDEQAREEILKNHLRGKPIGKIDYHKIAQKTKEYSGADLFAIIDQAIENKLEASFESGEIENIQTKDLLKGLKSIKTSTKEWFAQAKNFALFSNQAGTYDPILDYLNLKK